MSDIKISVVTGTLNRLEILKRVISNTVDNCEELELVLLDGGSTDGTIDYIKSLNHPRINLVEIGGRSSYPSYMNIGIKESKAEWIAQWNDDVLLINEWKDVINALNDNTDVYIFDWTRGSIEDFERKSFTKGWIHFKDCMNFGVYRKNIFREIGMYDNNFKYYECDHDMTTRCLCFGYNVSNRHDIKVLEVWKKVGDMSEKRALDFGKDDRNLWVNNLSIYNEKKLPPTVEKLM